MRVRVSDRISREGLKGDGTCIFSFINESPLDEKTRVAETQKEKLAKMWATLCLFWLQKLFFLMLLHCSLSKNAGKRQLEC